MNNGHFDPDIEDDPGTNNDDEFSVVSSAEYDIDIIEDVLGICTMEVEHDNPLFGPLEDRENSTPSRPKSKEYYTVSERSDDRSISYPNSLRFFHLDCKKSVCANNDEWLSKITSVSALVRDQSLAYSHGSMPFSDKMVPEKENLEDEGLEIGKSKLLITRLQILKIMV